MWQERAQTIASDRMLIDIGTTSLTGVRQGLVAGATRAVAHPVYRTATLSARQCALLGSDFERVGFLHEPSDEPQEELTDPYGVGWIFTDGYPAQFRHPLQDVRWKDIPKHPRPLPPVRVQMASARSDQMLAVLDAPCPGLLDTCFGLRGAWQFMDDLTGDWRIANALLDWSLETIEESYRCALSALPSDPDVIVYGDDLGFQSGMYLSDVDFRNFLYPRMQTLLARLRRMTNAAICLHSCGAIRSIVRDLAGLGAEMLNLDLYARNMLLAEVRKELPETVVLHAPVNLGALGEAVLEGNDATLALLACELAGAMPAIAAPIDSIRTAESLVANFHGASFVRALNADELVVLRDVGPVRSIIENARDKSRSTPFPTIPPDGSLIGDLQDGSPPGPFPNTTPPLLAAGSDAQ